MKIKSLSVLILLYATLPLQLFAGGDVEAPPPPVKKNRCWFLVYTPHFMGATQSVSVNLGGRGQFTYHRNISERSNSAPITREECVSLCEQRWEQIDACGGLSCSWNGSGDIRSQGPKNCNR